MDTLQEKLTAYADQVQPSKKELIWRTSEPTGGTENGNAKFPPRCDICKDLGFLRQDVPVGDPNFGKPVRCPNPIHYVTEAVSLSNLSTMRPEDQQLRISDIADIDGNKSMIAAAKRMVKEPYGWLYLYGGPGNAKTVALKAICNHLALKGLQPVVYIKFTRLLSIMRDSFAEQKSRREHIAAGKDLSQFASGDYQVRFDRLLKAKVLAIEEFDKANITAFAEEFRFDFFDERYEQGWRGETVTLFASNSGPEELPDALRSRVQEGRFMVVENKAGDARPGLTERVEGPLSEYWEGK